MLLAPWLITDHTSASRISTKTTEAPGQWLVRDDRINGELVQHRSANSPRTITLAGVYFFLPGSRLAVQNYAKFMRPCRPAKCYEVSRVRAWKNGRRRNVN